MDDIQLLRAAREDLTPHIARARARAWEVLQAQMDSPSSVRPRAVVPRGAWTSGGVGTRVWWLRGAAAVALALLLVLAGSPWRTPEVSTANAAALLNDLASVAATQPSAQPSTTGYRYTKVESTYQNMMVMSGGAIIATLEPRTREMWIAPDGSGRIRETAGDVVFLNERGHAAWVAMGSPPLGRTTNGDFGAGGLSYEDLTHLPANPTALAAVIRERAARTQVPIEDEMFVLIGDLLRQPGAPSDVRAALYRVAAGIPGVEVVGATRDHAGRPGIAVAKTSSYTGVRQRNVLIFDPRTSALLGEEHVLLESAAWVDAQPPVVIGYGVYLESRTVGNLPAN